MGSCGEEGPAEKYDTQPKWLTLVGDFGLNLLFRLGVWKARVRIDCSHFHYVCCLNVYELWSCKICNAGSDTWMAMHTDKLTGIKLKVLITNRLSVVRPTHVLTLD